MRTLSVMLLLAAGCSTEMITEPPSSTGQMPTAGNTIDPQVSYTPEVCHVNAWTTPAGAGRSVQIAVAPLAHGAAIFSVPTTGGPLTGFQIDQYGLLQGDPSGKLIRDGKFRSVHAGVVNDRIVTSVTDDGGIQLDAVSADLAQHAKLAALRGAYSAQVPVLHARDTLVLPTASEKGISYSTFDKNWQETHSLFAFHADQTSGMDAAQLHGEQGDTLVAWSTRTSCSVERLIAAQGFSAPQPCESPRLTSLGDGRVRMLFESKGKIGSYDLKGEDSDLKSPGFFTEPGTSPRGLFDGKREWVSYIDAHGTVLVGFLDETGNFVHTAIDQTPEHDAYELAMVDGAPWVFAVNETGYYAYEMCVVQK